MTDGNQSAPWEPWFVEPEPGIVRRALWIAVAWAYVAALAAFMVVAVAALVAFIVVLIVYLLDFSNQELEYAAIAAPARVVAWLAIPLAAGVAVWTAAYGSTQTDSFRRGVVGTAGGAVTALVIWFTGSLALPMIALAVAWALAIPAEHPGRWVARIVLAVSLLPFFPSWEGAGLIVIVIAALIGPLAAGASVFVGDLGWLGVLRLRRRGASEVIRAPTSLDL